MRSGRIDGVQPMRRSVRILAVVALLCATTLAAPQQSVADGSFLTFTFGGRSYKLYVPSRYQAGMRTSLLVMLHGCTQDPDSFANATQMNDRAEQETFLVAYPEQPTSANPSRCWNWFDPVHQARGIGEPALIAGIVGDVGLRYNVDPEHIHVAGLSAGAAMAVLLGATYPDIFASIAVGSGLEYKAATSVAQAFVAMQLGGPDPKQQGRLAYGAMGPRARVVPVLVFHGASDTTVNPVNGEQVVSQWAKTDDLAAYGAEDDIISDVPDVVEPGQVPGGHSYTRRVYIDSLSGAIVIESYTVDGMGHAWSGGRAGGSYTDPLGPDASGLSWSFFRAHSWSGATDTTPPVTTARPPGGPFSGTVSVTLTPDRPATTYYTTDTTTPTVDSAVYSAPLVFTATSVLRFFSRGQAGNEEAVRTEVYTRVGDGRSFSSIGDEDGYVGALPADGLSTLVRKVGNKGMYSSDTYRTILSFDTSSIPLTATISGASLRVFRRSLFGSVTSVPVDIRHGFFGPTSGLEREDYNAPASAFGVASLAVPESDGASSEVALPASALAFINRLGRTQFRLRSVTPVGFASDVLEIWGGDDGALAPTLTVSY
jgi:poly(hydroxyalkanoate) depolymerase family esterase